MHAYQPVDFILSAIVIIAFIAFLLLTRHWRERDFLNRFFSADEEARFFRKSIDDVRWARHHGCK